MSLRETRAIAGSAEQPLRSSTYGVPFELPRALTGLTRLAGVPQLKQRINFFEGAETCYGRSDKKSVFCFQR